MRKTQVGDRVEFLGFGSPEPYSKLAPGTLGTVTYIDALGTIHVDWDDGGRLGLIAGLAGGDRYKVVKAPS